jgi:peptidoglycan/xylan/chitin deacetylase (PgdA/CDA1 family)
MSSTEGAQESTASGRRSLKYIRLAAHLAALPLSVQRHTMKIEEIEQVVGERLPEGARFPSWWRNDRRRIHSRAWLTAGWWVESVDGPGGEVVFVRPTR